MLSSNRMEPYEGLVLCLSEEDIFMLLVGDNQSLLNVTRLHLKADLDPCDPHGDGGFVSLEYPDRLWRGELR